MEHFTSQSNLSISYFQMLIQAGDPVELYVSAVGLYLESLKLYDVAGSSDGGNGTDRADPSAALRVWSY